jgi:hypothetical protein
MIELIRIHAIVRIRYRTMKPRALLWILRRLMVLAEQLSRPEVA